MMTRVVRMTLQAVPSPTMVILITIEVPMIVIQTTLKNI
jgi:hypothetical protein